MNKNLLPHFSLLPSILVALTGLGLSLESRGQTTQPANPPAEIRLDTAPLDADIRAATSLAPVVRKATPSVVSVVITKYVDAREVMEELHPFLFREEGEGSRSRPSNRRMPVESIGSGVIVTEDGYILTNTHVVEEADEIQVVLSDGETHYEAKVIGTDPLTDVAVLKVEGEALSAITIADPATLEVGDLVLAIGNPFKVGQTVTSGMVSAKGRSGFFLRYEDYIQTDAPVNPGNSGGALVDAQGRLVGIITFIMSGAGVSAGVNFAIPVDLACFVLEKLVRDGEVRRGYLGVSLEERITSDLAAEFDLPSTAGALVTQVLPDGPAGSAGVAPGDFITAFNGIPVTDRRSLQFEVAKASPGTEAQLTLVRDGKSQTLSFRIGELDLTSIARSDLPRRRPVELLRGVELVELTETRRDQFDIPAEVRDGVLVARVSEDSPAFAAGLREGSVILGVARREVSSVEEVLSAAAASREGRLLLRVRLPGGPINYLVLRSRE